MFETKKRSFDRLFFSLSLIACAIWVAPVNGSVFSQNTRSAIDISAKALNTGSHIWTQAAFGIDLHKVFSGNQGDVGTLTLQPYILRVDDSPTVHGIFDDQHDWALQWRIANFNFTGLGHGRFNVRVGHFELPFGLEQVVQTNGTLYQVQTPTSLKADWGMSVNGRTSHFNYEVAYMTGSGNELDIDNSGLLVGRIGTPNHRAAWIGLSYLKGEIQASTEPLDRRRWGIDAGMLLPMGFSALGEFVRVSEADESGEHLYAELRWQTPSESLHVFSQWRQVRAQSVSGLDEEQTVTLGARFEPGRLWSLSAMVKHQLAGAESENQLTIQLRYRFQDVL